jgi:hypothetical protein
MTVLDVIVRLTLAWVTLDILRFGVLGNLRYGIRKHNDRRITGS